MKLANAVLFRRIELDFFFFVQIHQPLDPLEQGRHGVKNPPGFKGLERIHEKAVEDPIRRPRLIPKPVDDRFIVVDGFFGGADPSGNRAKRLCRNLCGQRGHRRD